MKRSIVFSGTQVTGDKDHPLAKRPFGLEYDRGIGGYFAVPTGHDVPQAMASIFAVFLEQQGIQAQLHKAASGITKIEVTGVEAGKLEQLHRRLNPPLDRIMPKLVELSPQHSRTI